MAGPPQHIVYILMGNETVSLAAAAAERCLKATLAEANQAFEYTHNIDARIVTAHLSRYTDGRTCRRPYAIL